MNISINERHEAIINRMLQTGDFSSPDEVIDAALELLEEQRSKLASLRDEIRKGFDSPSLPGEQVIERLIEKATDQAQQG